MIVGHSTGCQDAVRYAQRHRSSPSSSGGSGSSQPGSTPQQAGAAAAAAAPDAATLLGVVLQAPVSDVEFLSLLPGTAERIERAAAMAAAGQGEEIAFRATDIDGAPMTARRWLSLACPGGDDDMFSSSLSDEQLAAIFGPLRGLPSLLLLSGADQYVPPGVDYPAVGRRLAQVSQSGGLLGCFWPSATGMFGCLCCTCSAPIGEAEQAVNVCFASSHPPVLASSFLLQAIGPSAQLQTVEGALHAMDGKEEEGAAAIADFVAALLP